VLGILATKEIYGEMSRGKDAEMEKNLRSVPTLICSQKTTSDLAMSER